LAALIALVAFVVERTADRLADPNADLEAGQSADSTGAPSDA
jgi:hypothetical protein